MQLFNIIDAQSTELNADIKPLNALLQNFNEKISYEVKSEQKDNKKDAYTSEDVRIARFKLSDLNLADEFTLKKRLKELKELNYKELKEIATLLLKIQSSAAILQKKIKPTPVSILKPLGSVIGSLHVNITALRAHLTGLMSEAYYSQDNSLIQRYNYTGLLNSSQQTQAPPDENTLSPVHPDFDFFCGFLWSTRSKEEDKPNELFGYHLVGDSRQQQLKRGDTLYRCRLNKAFDRNFVFVPQGSTLCYAMSQAEYDKQKDLLPVHSLIRVERQQLFAIQADGTPKRINTDAIDQSDLDKIFSSNKQWVSDDALSRINITKQARIYRSIAREDIPEFPPALAWLRLGTKLRYELFRDYKKFLALDHAANQQHDLYADFYNAKNSNNKSELIASYKNTLQQIKRSDDTLQVLIARRDELTQKRESLSRIFQQKTRRVLSTLISNIECDIASIKTQTSRVLENLSTESTDVQRSVLSDPAVLSALKTQCTHFAVPERVQEVIKIIEEAKKDGAADLQLSHIDDLKEKLKKEEYKEVAREWRIKINHHLKENSPEKKALLNEAAKAISQHIHQKTFAKIPYGYAGKEEPFAEFITDLDRELGHDNFDQFFNSKDTLCHYLRDFADLLKIDKAKPGQNQFEQIIAIPLSNYVKQLNAFYDENKGEDRQHFKASLRDVISTEFIALLQFNLLNDKQKDALQKELSSIKSKASDSEHELIDTAVQLLECSKPNKDKDSVDQREKETSHLPNIELLAKRLAIQVLRPAASPRKVASDEINPGLAQLVSNIERCANKRSFTELALGLGVLSDESPRNNKEKELVKNLLQKIALLGEQSQEIQSEILAIENKFFLVPMNLPPIPSAVPKFSMQ